MTPAQIENSSAHLGFNGTQLQEQTYSVCFWLKEIALQLALLNDRDARIRAAVEKNLGEFGIPVADKAAPR